MFQHTSRLCSSCGEVVCEAFAFFARSRQPCTRTGPRTTATASVGSRRTSGNGVCIAVQRDCDDRLLADLSGRC